MSSVLECLRGENGNYILPFFWQHGEEESVLREYMRAIRGANITEVCLEARPHPDYAGEGWFRDVDIILDEARKLGMKIWILDDAHFPSGQAAGKMKDAPAELCKQFLNYRVIDAFGPMKEVTVDIAAAARYYKDPFAPVSIFGGGEKRVFDDDALFAVIASRLDGKENDIYHLSDDLLDLTDGVREGVLKWNVPAGSWRIYVIYQTHNGGGRSGYVNFLSRRSCRMQIDACYEPHFARYADEFGKTILGFFSDEPEIGNVEGYSGGDAAIGNPRMPLPWSEEMPAQMEARFGKNYRRLIPALWTAVGSDDFTADVRVGFMDIVSRLCQENFGGQIGEWCREHGVKYIGHIVEDVDNSTKLGSSQGHYFRALWGQDFAGIDDIGGQVTEGGADISHTSLLGFAADGEFYHHALGKLGVSLADIDPKKHGDSMCEIFGAYGWQEGTRLMKYELDHFLVRGINHFVPHAFSPKEFPDPDCPPHFYAHGKNPLYKPFGELMAYANRVAHLIRGGTHLVEAAVLYHAEAEWSGGRFMDMVKIARELDGAQIDCDFIPADVFSDPAAFDAELTEEGLRINGHLFRVLIIPGADYVPEAVLKFINSARVKKFPVLIAEFGSTEAVQAGTEIVPLHDIAAKLRAMGLADAVAEAFPELQVYHYRKGAEQYYLISNESICKTYQGEVKLPVSGQVYAYDAMQNRLFRTSCKGNDSTQAVTLKLEPYEMAVLVIPDNAEVLAASAEAAPFDGKAAGEARRLDTGWTVSFVENENYPDFRDAVNMDRLHSVLEEKPDFSGVIRYETVFEAGEGERYLLLEDAFEAAEVWVNGVYAGSRICPPYRFDLKEGIRPGSNTLRIEVRTTLERAVHKMTGGMSFLGPEIIAVTPSGIVGDVCVW